MGKRVKSAPEAVNNLAWIIGRAYPLVDNVQVEAAFESVALLAQKALVSKDEYLRVFLPHSARAERCWDRQLGD
jgi:hypothetical protein